MWQATGLPRYVYNRPTAVVQCLSLSNGAYSEARQKHQCHTELTMCRWLGHLWPGSGFESVTAPDVIDSDQLVSRLQVVNLSICTAHQATGSRPDPRQCSDNHPRSDANPITWPMQVAGPSIYRTYLAAARRLGLADGASGYWDLHITEDERHGRQMVEDVALPLVDRWVQNLFGRTQLPMCHANMSKTTHREG